MVDGQVRPPGREDLGAAHEQALGELIEWIPRPVADALVRLRGRPPLPGMGEGADGDPQGTLDVIDERAQRFDALGMCDQPGFLGEFADHRAFEGFPDFHAAAGRSRRIREFCGRSVAGTCALVGGKAIRTDGFRDVAWSRCCWMRWPTPSGSGAASRPSG